MIYKIRIILDADDDTFRDLEVESTMNLEDFHNVVAQSFGFAGNEMASFYTCDEDWKQDEEIALFDMADSGEELRLMSDTSLSDVLTEENPKLLYVYDFLSMWTFFVELADIVDNEDGRSYPNVLFSFGELPDAPPVKNFESESEFDENADFDYDDSLDSYEDMDFDENWN